MYTHPPTFPLGSVLASHLISPSQQQMWLLRSFQISHNSRLESFTNAYQNLHSKRLTCSLAIIPGNHIHILTSPPKYTHTLTKNWQQFLIPFSSKSRPGVLNKLAASRTKSQMSRSSLSNHSTCTTTTDTADTSSNAISQCPSTPQLLPFALLEPMRRRRRPAKLLRSFRSVFRTLPTCRIRTPSIADYMHGTVRATGTLFGHRRAGIALAIQDNPRSVPALVLELAIPTAKFLSGIGSSGMVRIAFECEKKAAGAPGGKTRLLDEPVWLAYVNGKSVGYATRREATEADLRVMQLLRAVSMGVGVLPAVAEDREVTYMRANFHWMVGSKDSETFHMIGPDGNGDGGPELSIFFIRI